MGEKVVSSAAAIRMRGRSGAKPLIRLTRYARFGTLSPLRGERENRSET